MEEVIQQFEATLQAQNDEPKSNFDGLYKIWGRHGNQEERRKELLEVQKTNRNYNVDRLRGIVDLVLSGDDEFHWTPQHRATYRPSIYVAGFNKVSPSYKNVLMLSEWMIEKPEDFRDEWYVVPCPEGVRMLCVASKGITKFYTKHGRYMFERRTSLPGGNPCNMGYLGQCCVLDCFYVKKINTMFVLDLLGWNNLTMTDCETEFRHYWLMTKFAEKPELKVLNKKNKIIFSILPKVPCTPQALNEFMSTHPYFENDFPPLDGLLFYHKRAHYVSGETPLVGWLYTYMVHEVIGPDVEVHNLHQIKPRDYVDQKTFIQQFEERMAKKWPKRNRKTSATKRDEGEMEVAKPEDSNVEDSVDIPKTATEVATMESEETSLQGQEASSLETQEENSSEENSLAEKMAQEVLGN